MLVGYKLSRVRGEEDGDRKRIGGRAKIMHGLIETTGGG